LKVKIIEALVHETAVVTTSVGAQGLSGLSPVPFLRADDGKAFAAELLRVGLVDASGDTVTNVDAPRESDKEPRRPVLVPLASSSGSGDLTTYSDGRSFWRWPLPPDGPLRLVCEWPAVGIGVGEHVLDGAAIHRAAVGSVPLWPRPVPAGS